MKRFKMKITTSGVIISSSGTKLRTPVELKNVNEKELQVYRVQCKARGLQYIIEDVTEDGLSKPELPSISKRVIIEELTQSKNSAEPESFLDKLILEQESQEKKWNE